MLFTSFTYHCYIVLLIRNMSVPLCRSYSGGKKQHQAQAKHPRHISNSSSHLHGPGHIPVLALWADPSYAGENKNVQSHLEWYLSRWFFSPLSTTLLLDRVEWSFFQPYSGSSGKVVIHQVCGPALGANTACPNELRSSVLTNQPFQDSKFQLVHLSESERVQAYCCFRK